VSELNYEASDATAGLPVSLEELRLLVATSGKPLARDPRKLNHLLVRVLNTLDAHNEDLASLRRTVDTLRSEHTRNGTPSTLNPMDAIRFASPEQIEEVVGRLHRDRLVNLRTLVDQARDRRDELDRLLEHSRLLIAAALNTPGLGADSAARLEAILAGIPPTPEQVPVPGILDYPDMQAPAQADPFAASPAIPAPTAARPAARPADPYAPDFIAEASPFPAPTWTPPAAPPVAASPAPASPSTWPAPSSPSASSPPPASPSAWPAPAAAVPSPQEHQQAPDAAPDAAPEPDPAAPSPFANAVTVEPAPPRRRAARTSAPDPAAVTRSQGQDAGQDAPAPPADSRAGQGWAQDLTARRARDERAEVASAAIPPTEDISTPTPPASDPLDNLFG